MPRGFGRNDGGNDHRNWNDSGFSDRSKSRSSVFRRRFADEMYEEFQRFDEMTDKERYMEWEIRESFINGDFKRLRKFLEEVEDPKQYQKVFNRRLIMIYDKYGVEKITYLKKELGEIFDFDEAIKELFFWALTSCSWYDAKEVKDKLGEGIDFTEEVEEVYYDNIDLDDLSYANQIARKFGLNLNDTDVAKKTFKYAIFKYKRENMEEVYNRADGKIDFSEEIKEGYLHALEDGCYEEAEHIEETYGKGLDLIAYAKEHKEKLIKGFRLALEQGNLYDTQCFQKILEDEDLTPYIKESFLSKIGGFSTTYAEDIYRIYKKEIDFEDEVRAGLMKMFANSPIHEVGKFFNFIGNDFDLSSEVEKAFREFMETENYSHANSMEKSFSGALDFAPIVKEYLSAALENGEFNQFDMINDNSRLGLSIEEKKLIFSKVLSAGNIEDAITIKNKYTAFEDLSKECKAKEEHIKKGVATKLAAEDMAGALKIMDEIGKGIDFSSEIKKEELFLVDFFDHTDVDTAQMMYNHFGKVLDFSKTIKEFVEEYFRYDHMSFVMKVIDTMGEGLDFSELIIENEPKIKDYFREALKNLHIDTAEKILKCFGDVLDFQDIIKNQITSFFSHSLDDAHKLYQHFGQDVDMKKEIKDNFDDLLLSRGVVDRALQVKEHFGQGVDFSSSIAKFKKTLAEQGLGSSELGQWFATFVDFLGFEKVFRLTFNVEFWSNTHDNLLFVDKLISNDEEKNIKIKEIFKNIFVSGINFREFNRHIGSFDLALYEESNGLTPLKNWTDFMRVCKIHSNNIRIPVDASDSFREAMTELVAAPGVDIKFLKQLIQEYRINILDIQREKDNYKRPSFYHNSRIDRWHNPRGFGMGNSFASRVVDIIEGKEDIDSEQIIKPFEEIIPFDPLNKLVFSALGINEINKESIEYSKLFKQDENLKSVIVLLTEYNEQLRKEIREKYESLIKSDTDKKDKYRVDMEKELENMTLLQYESGNKLKGVNYMNLETSLIDLDIQEKLKGFLFDYLQEEKSRILLLESLFNLYNKKDKLQDNLELVHFEELAVIGEKLFVNSDLQEKIDAIRAEKLPWKEKAPKINQAKKDFFQSISIEKMQDILEGNEIWLLVYMIYLGYNNLKKQAESRNLNRKLMEIINTPKYLRILDQMKEKGLTAGNQKPLQAYIGGDLQLEEEDIDRVKEVLNIFGYDNMGRSLKIEIAKKSDPRGWVCGDYTDCCMPFTSGKNKEYMTREDMAYFLVSIVDEHGNEDLVTQSVLVAAKKNKFKKKFKILAVDNIEIANRAIKYRAIISQAYSVLKEKFPKKKIIIGTSYNDDGGAVTGQCEMEPRKAVPMGGNMKYSDCFDNHEAYVFYDPNSKEREYKYYPVQIDNIDSSSIRQRLSREELSKIKLVLQKIGKGEDDGEGGLLFPDNYSAMIDDKDGYKGYIVAADYLVSYHEDNNLTVEMLGFEEGVSREEKKKLLEDYVDRKRLKGNESLDRLVLKNSGVGEEERDIIKEIFEGYDMGEKDDLFYVIL